MGAALEDRVVGLLRGVHPLLEHDVFDLDEISVNQQPCHEFEVFVRPQTRVESTDGTDLHGPQEPRPRRTDPEVSQERLD
jgi:hypothetical protein